MKYLPRKASPLPIASLKGEGEKGKFGRVKCMISESSELVTCNRLLIFFTFFTHEAVGEIAAHEPAR